MRTLELLKSLPEKELKQIEGKIAGSKRKTLFPLFKELKKLRHKKEDALNRKDLFTKTFNKPYAKNKDYLLRNELRLLNDIIYDYLVADSFNQHLAQNKSLYNRWLAQSFFDRKMSVFVEEINDYINYAKDHVQLDEASAMFALRSAWASSYPIGSKERDRSTALAHVKEWEYEEKRRFLHRLRRIEFSETFFERFTKHGQSKINPDAQDWSVPGETLINFTEIDDSDWYARYLNLQKKYAQSKGKAQLNYLREMIQLINSPQGQIAIKPESRVKSVEAMATNLYMNNRYEEAHTYMEEAMAMYKKERVPINPPCIAIYLGILLLLKKYHAAIALYNEYRSEANASVSRSHCIVIIAYSYLFLARPDEALALLQQGVNLLPVEVLHSRYIYLIAFILRKQYDLAANEIKNLKRILANNSTNFSGFDPQIVAHFQTYLRISLKPSSSNEKQTAQLKADITKTGAAKTQPFNIIQLKWLREHLERTQ